MAQIGRPIADVAIGNWTKQDLGTSSLYTVIDETVADDTDYIRATDPDATTYKATIGPLGDPVSSSGHKVRYEIARIGSGNINIALSLRQGSTEIATWSHAAVGTTATEYEQTLTSGQADAITDYTALQLWATADISVFRDVFTTAVDPIATPRNAEPGPSTWTVAGSLWKIISGALRGGGQSSSPAWGSSRLKHTDGLSRTAGRALVAYVIPEDAGADLAVGWATGTVADPRTDGHAWLNENGVLAVAAPSLKVVVNTGTHVIRPLEYLVIVALNATGATYLLSTHTADTGLTGGSNDVLGIPAYPSARVVWIEDTATTATMYPVISAYDTLDYPNQTFLDDLRVIDVAAWSGSDHALATLVDRVTRADSTTSIGTGWTSNVGTWGVSSNKAYLVTHSGFDNAHKDSGLTGDGIWKYKLTFDTTSATRGIGCIIRRVDASNYIRIWTNGAASIAIQSWVGGGFDNTIASTGFTWTTGTTYDITVITSGNLYKMYINGVDPFSSESWQTDNNSRHLTGTGFGPFANVTTDARWDDFIAMPNTVTLPAQLQSGAVPSAWTVGSTQVTDTFAGTNGTRLNAHTTDTGSKTYTEHVGTWTIQSNRASVSGGSGLLAATFDEVTDDFEASVDVIMPSSFATNTIRAGLTFKYQDVNNFLACRLYKDSGTCEIELLHTSGGTGLGGGAGIVHKLDLTASAYVVSTTYNLKVQINDTPYGELVRVFLDGKPRLSYVLSTPSVGTRVGLYKESNDDGCVFDNLSVKAIS